MKSKSLYGLNETEKSVYEDVETFLRTAKGENKAVTSGMIIKHIQRTRDIKLSGGSLRGIIHVIRMSDGIKNLIAGNSGYWVEEDPMKIYRYAKSLKERGLVILTLANKARGWSGRGNKKKVEEKTLSLFD